MAGGFNPHNLAHLVERNILIVSGSSFRRWCEDRLRKRIGFFQSRRKLDAGNFAGSFVFLPGRTRDVSAYHALHRKHVGALHQHGTSTQLVGVFSDRRRILIHISRNQMVRNDVGEVIEPEQGDLAQDVSLVRDSRGQNVIEGGNAVGGNEEQLLVAYAVDVPHLAAGMKVKIAEVCL